MWLALRTVPKGHVFKRDQTMSSKYDNHPNLNNQYNWVNQYDHLPSTKIFDLIMTKILIWAPKIIRKLIDLDLDLITISC